MRPARAAAALGAALALALVGAGQARAREGRLVVGTSDPALVAALSVAVSSRGLSVVERAEPLLRVDDVGAAREEVLAPHTVAVVWLCDDDAGAHALCYCDHEGRLVVKPTFATAPLAPADAAAVALSVKLLLWGTTPSRPSAPPSPPPPSSASFAKGAPPPADAAPPPPPLRLAVEVAGGARLQSPTEQHVAPRVGAKVTAFLGRERLLGLGAGLGAGPSFVVGPARRVNDLSLVLFARGRHRVAAAWLELDAGPSLHALSGAVRRADLSADVLLGLVVPAGRLFFGARAGGFVVVTTPSSAGALPRWTGEAALTAGLTYP